MDDLKPCPFCGREAKAEAVKLVRGGGVEWAQVECMTCEAVGPQPATRAQAIDAWNTRHEATALTEARAEVERVVSEIDALPWNGLADGDFEQFIVQWKQRVQPILDTARTALETRNDG